MRTRHIVVAALVLLGVGIKLTFFSTMTAEADSKSKGSADVSQTQHPLLVEKFHDMTFVFPVGPGG